MGTRKLDRREFLKISAAGTAALSTGAALFPGAKALSAMVTKQGDPVVALFTTMADAYFVGYEAGAKQASAALGLKYERFLNEGKPETELSQFETSAGKGVKMITIIPPDEAGVPLMARKANDLKVHTVTTWETPPWYFPYTEGDYLVTYLAPDSKAGAKQVNMELVNKLGGKGEILHISGWPGGTSDRLKSEGLYAALEGTSIKILGSLPGKWNRIDSRKATEDLMTRFPKFDAIACQNDDIAIGAMTALDAAGQSMVPITGNNGTAEAAELVRAGKLLATQANFPFWLGGYCVVKAFDAANGWKPTIPERMMYFGDWKITQDNVDEYITRYVDSIDKLEFDWRKMSRVLSPDDWDPQNSLKPFDPYGYFGETPKPEGRDVPENWKKAEESGEMERVAQLYQDHYKKKIMSK